MKRRLLTVGLAALMLAGCAGGPPVLPSKLADANAVAKQPVPPSDYHPRVVDARPVEPLPAAPVERTSFPAPLNPPTASPLPAAPPSPPRAPDAPLVEALRRILDRQPAAALALLQRYDSPSREVLLALLQLAVPLGEGGLEQATPQETAALLEQLHSVLAALRARAPLLLDKLCFCRREVRNFGKFDALPQGHTFQTGSEGRPGELVEVYVEVRNFACRLRNNAYETALAGSVEIHDFRGEVVWRKDFPAWPDRSQTPRQDYFLTFGFHVPPRLPPDATYTLWVQVKDVGAEGAPRVARRSLDFRVRAPKRGEAITAD